MMRQLVGMRLELGVAQRAAPRTPRPAHPACAKPALRTAPAASPKPPAARSRSTAQGCSARSEGASTASAPIERSGAAAAAASSRTRRSASSSMLPRSNRSGRVVEPQLQPLLARLHHEAQRIVRGVVPAHPAEPQPVGLSRKACAVHRVVLKHHQRARTARPARQAAGSRQAPDAGAPKAPPAALASAAADRTATAQAKAQAAAAASVDEQPHHPLEGKRRDETKGRKQKGGGGRAGETQEKGEEKEGKERREEEEKREERKRKTRGEKEEEERGGRRK